jgi:hypothetical protein
VHSLFVIDVGWDDEKAVNNGVRTRRHLDLVDDKSRYGTRWHPLFTASRTAFLCGLTVISELEQLSKFSAAGWPLPIVGTWLK